MVVTVIEGVTVFMRNLWLIIFFATLVWSGIYPKDYLTWLLEVFPALVGLAVLVATRLKFPLTSLTYALVLFHCVILMWFVMRIM